MLPYQKRVIDEKIELDDKREKLLVFINTQAFNNLDQAEKIRLRRQCGIMGVYSEILQQRISAFQTPQIGDDDQS